MGWLTNSWIAVDANGDIVSYEAVAPEQLQSGKIDTSSISCAFQEAFSVDKFLIWQTYDWECRALLLDNLSRRAKRVVKYSIIMDSKSFRRVRDVATPYLKPWVSGK